MWDPKLSNLWPRKYCGYHHWGNWRHQVLLYEQFTAEVLYHTALAIMFHEGVVFLGCSLCQGLEPVGIVGGAHLQGPLFHTLSHCICDASVQTRTMVHHVDHLVIDIGRQVFVHLLTVEDVLTEILGRSFGGCFHLDGLFLEGLFHDLKS